MGRSRRRSVRPRAEQVVHRDYRIGGPLKPPKAMLFSAATHTQGVIMTATETTTTETPTTGTPTTEAPSSPPLVRPPRGVLTAAGLAVFAAVAITPWLLTTSSQTQISPITPTSGQRRLERGQRRPSSRVCAVLPQQPLPVHAGSVHTGLHRLRPVLSEQSSPLRSRAQAARSRLRQVLPEQPGPLHGGETPVAQPPQVCEVQSCPTEGVHDHSRAAALEIIA
jgi:hypothetical protein